MTSIYALLYEYPGAEYIAKVHLTKLTNLLSDNSKGRYGKDIAVLIRDTARKSIGSKMHSKSIELKHTIKLIRELDEEINEIENEIKLIMDKVNSPILSIPGISYRMGAMIIAELGDISRFESPNNILAYAGLSPSIYQSGQLDGAYAHMEKRGSRYLRYALYNSAKYVSLWDPTFSEYLSKKRAEGKHYNVAISHVAKKLVRVIYHLEKTNQQYIIKA
jgi:transposase